MAYVPDVSMHIMLTNIGFLCSNLHMESYLLWLSSLTQVQRALPSVEFVEEAMMLLNLRNCINHPIPLLSVSPPTTSQPSGSTTPPSSPLSEPTSPTGLLNRCWSPLELGTRSYRATADFFRVGRDRPLPYVLA